MPHAVQCLLISYPPDYKGWKFWCPESHKEVILDSAVFCKSIFPFHKPGLSGLDVSIDPSPPSTTPPTPHVPTNLLPPPLQVPSVPVAPLPPLADNGLAPVDAPNPARLVVRIRIPPVVPPPPPPSPSQWRDGPAVVVHSSTLPVMSKFPCAPPPVRR